MKACKTCLHYCPDRPGAKQGTCRAKSPTVMLLGIAQAQPLPGLKMNGAAQPITQGFFPPVGEHIWCGEHAPIPAPQMLGRPAEAQESAA